MVFSTTALFKHIKCPAGAKCDLTSCIYAHDSGDAAGPEPSPPLSAPAPAPAASPSHAHVEPPTKRRKFTHDTLADKLPSKADLIRNQLATVRANPSESAKSTAPNRSQSPASLAKPVSPPPARAVNGKAASQPATASASAASKTGASDLRQPEKVESLNPRLIPNDPAGHQKRSLFLKHIHGELVRLNKLVKDSADLEHKTCLSLSGQQLIKIALDEEEKIAREQPKLYANVIKNRFASLKKMHINEYILYLKSNWVKDEPKPAGTDAKPVVETGLQIDHEHLILPQLVADQKPLAAFGYIPTPPTDAEAAEAAAAVEASKNYEICDRCSARFQVFPGRNEEGLLTSNGPCKHHPYRKVFPQRTKADKGTGPKEPYYPCCHEKVGAPGCTTSDEHVFKTSSPARLHSILPFAPTPENTSPAKDRRGGVVKAVTFDCEMGYTAFGLELIRLTAVSWPHGHELLDILVRPLGSVIDLNSRFSGVFAEHLQDAIPYDDWKSSPPPPPLDNCEGKPLPIVDSPQRARELLCSFLTPTTPLIGHAIDNDLNTVRLCHPTIIDTIILFPHPRGLPMRFGLKMLTQKHLKRAIQQGGDRGHDSREDAVATGDLVRVKVGEKWKDLKISGWQIYNEQLIPPSPQGLAPSDLEQFQHVTEMVQKGIFGSGKNRKKRRSSMDGADDSSSEDAEGAEGDVPT